MLKSGGKDINKLPGLDLYHKDGVTPLFVELIPLIQEPNCV